MSHPVHQTYAKRTPRVHTLVLNCPINAAYGGFRYDAVNDQPHMPKRHPGCRDGAAVWGVSVESEQHLFRAQRFFGAAFGEATLNRSFGLPVKQRHFETRAEVLVVLEEYL